MLLGLSYELVGAWISVFLTLSIFSYLYDDNPFYKAAEHLYIGVSAGYIASLSFWTQVYPNLYGRLWPKIDNSDFGIIEKVWYSIYKALGWVYPPAFPKGGIEGHEEIRWIYVVPLILGIMMLLRLIPKLGWLARWPIAYIIGMAAGLRMYGYLNSDVLLQIQASIIDFSQDWTSIINSLIILIGTLSGLIYFFFSKEHTGIIGKVSKIGIYVLMIKFGASFGYAVMGRISLLIGRFDKLIKYTDSSYFYATYWGLGIVILGLTFWTISNKKFNKRA